MAINFNVTTLADGDTDANFTQITPAPTGGGTFAKANNTDYSQRFGGSCEEFTYSAAVTNGGLKLTTNVTAFSILDNEVGIWFLNGKFDGDGAEILGTTDQSLRVRVYATSGNWADYYQVQHKNKIDGTYNGGWLYLRASGDAGTEDANSGTWTSTDAQNIVNIGVVVNTQVAISGNSDPAFAVDWFKYYDRIEIEGYNGGTTPWTNADIVAAANVTPSATGPVGIWGVIENFENFFKFFCGLNFGQAVPTAGGFSAENEFMFLAHSSSDFKLDVVVQDDFLVNLGEKNDTGTFTYAQDGVQLVATENGFFAEVSPVKCAPALTVESGALFDAYATLVQGFGTVNLGSGNTAQVDDIELIGADFYDNDEIEFRSTRIEVDNIRIHQDSADKSDLGAIYAVPTQFDRVQTFNGTTGLTFRVTMTADRFFAGDLTNDFAVLDGQAVTMLSSEFDGSTISRVV